MVITEVTVSWTETANLGNYSNVKPAISMTAQLAEDDDPRIVADKLLLDCRARVQELVDQALESVEDPARYSTDPRYDVWIARIGPRSVYVIAPSGDRLDRHPRLYRVTSRHRHHLAFRIAHQRATIVSDDDDAGDIVIDAADGDMVAVETKLSLLWAAEEARLAVESKRRAQMAMADDDALLRKADDDEDRRREDDDEEEEG